MLLALPDASAPISTSLLATSSFQLTEYIGFGVLQRLFPVFPIPEHPCRRRLEVSSCMTLQPFEFLGFGAERRLHSR